MLRYDDYRKIASAVLDKIIRPEELDDATAKMLDKKYLQDDSVIDSLVEAEMANYDTSGNSDEDLDEIKSEASDEVFFTIDDVVSEYFRVVDSYNDSLRNDTYVQIIDAIRDIDNVADVDTDFEPRDSSVGLYHDIRTVTVTLTNGAVITMNVEFDD